MKRPLNKFKGMSVLVIGDIMLDKYIWGEVNRISPEAPVPVVEVVKTSEVLGGAGNVINNLLSLGAKVVFCGAIGEDFVGETILDTLNDRMVNLDGFIMCRDRKTTVKTRIVAHNQQIVRVDEEVIKPLEPHQVSRIIKVVEANLDAVDIIIVSDYGKGVVSAGLMKKLKDRAGDLVKIIVDPKTGNFHYYRHVDCLTPNHHEAGDYCGYKLTTEEALSRGGEFILETLNCKSVLITQGKNGMILFERDKDPVHIPTVAKKVFDVSGAGDTVISVLSLGLAVGMPMKEAARLANVAAGVVVGEVGTSTITLDKLEVALC